MIRATDIQDRYDNRHGEWLRVWSIDDNGQPQCLVDAFLVADLTAQEVSDQEAANAVVRVSIEAVEAYEGALKLVEQNEPPATITVYDEQGNESEVTNPDHTEWVAAGELVEGVSPETLTLAQKRDGTWVDPDAPSESS